MDISNGRPLQCQRRPTEQKAEVGAQPLLPPSRAKTEAEKSSFFFLFGAIFHFISDGKRCTVTSFNYYFVSPVKKNPQKAGSLSANLFLPVKHRTDHLQAVHFDLSMKRKTEGAENGEEKMRRRVMTNKKKNLSDKKKEKRKGKFTK